MEEFKLAVQAAHPTVRTKKQTHECWPNGNSYFETKSLNMSIYQQERLTDSYVFGNELMFD